MGEKTKKPPLVLVVDDEESIRALLKRQMETDGYTVATADNGRNAITAAFEAAPDVVLLDALMPEMDGFEVAEVLKSTDATKRPSSW
jgi:CheY-like chemotaxis protein